MSTREMYEYAYYKVYKSVAFIMEWGADWRAGGLLVVFLCFIPWSLIIYAELLFPDAKHVSIWWFMAPIVFFVIIDFITIQRKDRWKEIVERYDAWPRQKSFIGTLIVWGVVALITANFFIAIYMVDAARQM